MTHKIYNEDSREGLKRVEDNTIDSIVTDPPYELTSSKTSKKGFMNKDWDGTGIAHDPTFWEECLRVLKPGGYLLSFGGARTYHKLAYAIELAGFELHPMICWTYGEGLPKATDLPKQFEKLENQENQVEYWKGWKYGKQSLKPAIEPICMAQKPPEGKRMTDNVLKWGVGAVNIDDSRVGKTREKPQTMGSKKTSNCYGEINVEGGKVYTEGRFPANLVLTHHPDCELIGNKDVGKSKEGGYTYETKTYEVEGFLPKCKPKSPSNYGTETVEKWNCVEGCPIKEIDGQNKQTFSSGGRSYQNTNDMYSGGYKEIKGNSDNPEYKDSGGVSRYFNNFSYSEEDFAPFYYCAKASKSERNEGLDHLPDKTIARSTGAQTQQKEGKDSYKEEGYNRIVKMKNIHPSVKPIKLMRWLVKLVTPPGGTVLDPFTGSGTTGIACAYEDFNFIGFEIDTKEGFVDIANARINYAIEKRGREDDN